MCYYFGLKKSSVSALQAAKVTVAGISEHD
jgi:hypothetical protein